ncbi:MAG: glycosyltransferase [Anaerolinea sp.]|nr:glycosyltransferase [Anaerolinea sp.]
MLLSLLTALYVLCALALTAFALGTTVLLITYLRHRNDLITASQVGEFPKVAVQLPVYNERYVVERLIKAVAALDYPREKLIIQVLDDSTDDTSAIIARVVAPLKARGVQIEHIQRPNREGFKAGALAYGLSLIDVEYTVVLDADFVLPRDFLLRTLPALINNPDVGMVQTRWGHLNRDDNALTKGQALALDGHFVVEQTARSRSGLLMNFNGSGGVWRVKAIHEAGGWQDTTLTEDLDLSYRAQLIGWRFLYLPDVVVPGELPPEIAAYKQQQARWAKGGTQCFALLFRPVWTHPRLTLMQKLMATMHLAQYLVHPVIIVMILVTPPLLLTGAFKNISLGWLGIVGLGPPILYVISQQAIYGDWQRRVLALPTLIALGTGMAWSNTRAVMGGFFLSRKEEFKRTPKFAQQRTRGSYARLSNRSFLFELLLSLYAGWGVIVAYRAAPTFIPYLLVYAVAFGLIAWWGVRDSLRWRLRP